MTFGLQIKTARLLVGLTFLSCSKRNESEEALEAALHAASDFAGEIPVETYIDEIAFEGELADRIACASPGYYDIIVTSETVREGSSVTILAQQQQWSVEAYCDSLSFGAAGDSFDRETGAASVTDGQFCDRDAQKAAIDWTVPVFRGEHLL